MSYYQNVNDTYVNENEYNFEELFRQMLKNNYRGVCNKFLSIRLLYNNITVNGYATYYKTLNCNV